MDPYVFGAAALDALLGYERALRIDLYLGDSPVNISDVRQIFGITEGRAADFTYEEPTAWCSADEVTLNGRGIVIDRRTGDEWRRGHPSFDLYSDPGISDAVRLAGMLTFFPEISIDTASLRLIRAKVAFAQSRSREDPSYGIILANSGI